MLQDRDNLHIVINFSFSLTKLSLFLIKIVTLETFGSKNMILLNFHSSSIKLPIKLQILSTESITLETFGVNNLFVSINEPSKGFCNTP